MALTGLLRSLAAGAVLAALAVPSGFAASQPASDHARAEAALSDIRAAVTAIMEAENATSSGPARYKLSAKRAINALVGSHDPAFDSKVSNPGNATGAIGEVNHLLDRIANPPFVPILHGVLINLQSAVASLQDALKTRGIDDYEESASQALETLEIAEGRPDAYDVFGGMEGAIANTELGVPAGAPRADGCAAPKSPGYGVTHGWLVWRAVPLDDNADPADGGAIVRKEGSMLVFYTPAAAMVHHLCATAPEHSAAHTKARPAAVQVTKTPPPVRLIRVADSSDGSVSYTEAQARSGKAIYMQHCDSCHGKNLQGVSAPAIAGTEFLTVSHKNNYTVSILNTIVTQNMPFNDPGGLKPTEYADVMSFLLASNCFPAGKTPYPSDPGSTFGTAKISIPAHPAGTPDKNGMCEVK